MENAFARMNVNVMMDGPLLIADSGSQSLLEVVVVVVKEAR